MIYSTTATKITTTQPSKNDKRPIARFYRCWLEDMARGILQQNCRGINHEQYRAADRLICNYQRLLKSNCKGYVEVPTDKNLSNNTDSFDSRVEAMQQHSRVCRRLSVKSQQILEHFCLREQPLGKFELAQVPRWNKGAGIARLREALDDLIEVYRKLGA